MSRSMSTIVGGMANKLTRKKAAEFSFFLAVPTMAGATILDVHDMMNEKRRLGYKQQPFLIRYWLCSIFCGSHICNEVVCKRSYKIWF